MGIVESLVTLVMGDRRHTAHPIDNNFAENATLEIDGDSSILTVDLNTVVADGNDIQKINFSREGVVEASKEAYPGDEKTELSIDGIDLGEQVLTLTYVDSENSVIAQDSVQIEPLNSTRSSLNTCTRN